MNLVFYNLINIHTESQFPNMFQTLDVSLDSLYFEKWRKSSRDLDLDWTMPNVELV